MCFISCVSCHVVYYVAYVSTCYDVMIDNRIMTSDVAHDVICWYDNMGALDFNFLC